MRKVLQRKLLYLITLLMLLLSFILFQNNKSSKFLCSVYYSNFEVYRFIYEDILKILINFNVIKLFLFQQVSLKINVFKCNHKQRAEISHVGYQHTDSFVRRTTKSYRFEL